jgi:Aldehyde dehydrogenase family
MGVITPAARKPSDGPRPSHPICGSACAPCPRRDGSCSRRSSHRSSSSSARPCPSGHSWRAAAPIPPAIAYVNSRPRPLALYFFGHNGPGRQLVLERTTSGGVSINETNLHYAQEDIPFGGIGPSGMGAYHGYEGFKTLSHAKGIFEQARFNFTDAIRPPFGRLFERVIGFLTR